MEIKVLHAHGWSVSQLAREFGLSRTTIRRELASEAPRRYPQRSKPTALSDAQRAHIERRLAMCPALRGSMLYHELCREYQYVGSYPAFIRHLRTLRPVAATEPVVRFETAPGVQVQADWAHLGVWPLEDTMTDLFGLVAILSSSRAPAVRIAADHTRVTTLERLVRCLDDLGGAPHEILTDRDPVFCIGQTSDGKAILAPEWVDLCAVLDVVPRACRPYRAKTKGTVERLVREVKESFLAWLGGQIVVTAPGHGPTVEVNYSLSDPCTALQAYYTSDAPAAGWTMRMAPRATRIRSDIDGTYQKTVDGITIVMTISCFADVAQDRSGYDLFMSL